MHTLYFDIFQGLPVLGEESGQRITEDLALVIYVLQNVLGPLHQVTDLVAR